MNIRFDRVDIENFRSIKSASVPLSNQGTVIVKGVNEYEDKATSNGSGKSSIFEAIIFALFEETSSGEKDVANRIVNNGFSVTLNFSIDADDYTISRVSSNNKSSVTFLKNGLDISARNKTDTNKLIINTLGITKDIFLDSVFLSQNAVTNLASLSPTARKERLEILTNTDYTITEFKDKLKKEQLSYESNCVKVKLEITKLDGKIDAINKQKSELQSKIDAVDLQIAKRNLLGNIDEIDANIDTAQKDISSITLKLDEVEKQISSQDDLIDNFRKTGDDNLRIREEISNQVVAKREECSTLSNEIYTFENEVNQCNREISRLTREIDKIKNSDTCPTCGRKYDNVNEEHIIKSINELEEGIKAEETKIAEINKNRDDRCQVYDIKVSEGKELRAKLDGLDAEIDKFKVELNELDVVRKNLINERQNLSNTIKTLQSNIDSYRAIKDQILQIDVGNKDEFVNMIANLDDEIKSIEISRKELENIYNENNDCEDIVKSCLQLTTKDFRTYLLKSSIQYLNKLLSMYSRDLFSNQKDVITISDDDSKLDIRLGDATYESLSGGERTRVNIALLLSQKSLANIVGNVRCNIIILDEILGYCDNQAEENVIELITKELDDLESIYMVSHKEIPVGYDSQLVVIKDKSGLSMIREY